MAEKNNKAIIPMRTVLLQNRHPKTKYPQQAAAAIIALLDAHAPKFLNGAPDGEL